MYFNWWSLQTLQNEDIFTVFTYIYHLFIYHIFQERTKNAQFIIISLRNNMFELADRLIGIYKTYNCTKCVPIDPRKITIPLANKDLNTTASTSSTTATSSGKVAEATAPSSPGNREVPVGS